MLNKENHYEFAWNSTRVKQLKSNIWQNPRHLDILKYEQGDQPKATSEVENKERIIANAVAQTVESSFVVEQLKNPQDSIDSLLDISENVNSDTDGALFQIS